MMKDISVKVIDHTVNAEEMIRLFAMQSYVTQFESYSDQVCVKFASGRLVPLDQLPESDKLKVGHYLAGYSKDDKNLVAEIGRFPDRSPSPDGAVRFLRRIGHLRPFESCVVTFEIECSRKACLHIIRHNFTWHNFMSQKYLHQRQFEYMAPTGVNLTPESVDYYQETMEIIQDRMEVLRDTFHWDPEDYRGVLPNMTWQKWMFGTNFRQLYWLFDVFCDDDYVRELRLIGMQMLKHMKKLHPVFFEHYSIITNMNGVEFAKRKTASVGRGNKVHWAMPPGGLDKILAGEEV